MRFNTIEFKRIDYSLLIRTKQRVQEYADMLRVSRITLNSSVMSQFGVSANHLLKQRLLEELKNELLFAN